ncbi:isoleucyl-tRNA synthetase [Croceifilum oryzae]|uniref:Isoleucine--tRNA ligase n=1 Tax=Croceifilum oryzae TaxID=1553429 RepID=A0AAJ1WSX7_9BACL|nr:isoleucine--tRNA ligase [Croceifilum oryzae]MDQ0416411.1 isoleucyl-tRNA synthetase [Croceifilum oryzae]
MADYRSTIHLPVTDFPMKGNLPNREPEMQKWWDEIDIYRLVQEKRKGSPQFILHDGPPYANGDIHVGHVLNKSLKDFVVRYKSLNGFDAPYVPGWDTHGLPIEHAVVTKKKVDRRSVSVVDFRNLCTEYALSFVEKQADQFKRMAIRGDFENPYITLQPEYESAQIRLFGDMARKGHIYRGMRTVYWSPTSESALAEAEIEYQEKRSASVYVKFPVQNGNGILDEENTFVVIWTTTPWTIPANLAISLNPEFEYSAVQVGNEKYIMATELVEAVMTTAEVEEYEVVSTWAGRELNGVVCRHPFYDRPSPLVFGEHVTLEAGTGCVHTAPGHGEEDFAVGQRYGLEVLCPVDGRGVFTAQAPGFEGMFYEDGNKRVSELLQERGLLLKLSFIKHQYPHDWRTKKPIIYRATEQWFASIDGFRGQMLEEIKDVEWVPTWGEVRLGNMIADRGDWCISRQRTWGVPIPIFYCQDCTEPHINDETIDFIANLFAKEGSTSWYAKDVSDLMPADQKCSKCGCTSFRKETDIMDVWFDSGSSHFAVLAQRDDLSFPADLYIEGSDQYRGWFNSSLSTSVATTGKAPYKQVVSHGYVLDGEGRKMSKSIGNVVDPNKVANQYGADILRLWVSSVDYQSDVRISDPLIKQVAEVYRKLRNTFRFLLGNLADFDPAENHVRYDQLTELDRYVLSKLQGLIKTVTQGYDTYDFHQVYGSIHTFCTVFLSQFYLDVLKDILYVEETDSLQRRSAQTVMYEILRALDVMISPIIPHTAEEVWKYIPGVSEQSVQLADFPVMDGTLCDQALEDKWDRFLDIRSVVLKALEQARAEKLIGNSLGATIEIVPNLESAQLLANLDNLHQLFIVSGVEVLPASSEVPAEQMVEVIVHVAEGDKCNRCWTISPTVGTHSYSKHQELCERCASIVEKEYPDFEVEAE